MNEEKTTNEIMETTIGDDTYLIVPADEYEIEDFDEDNCESSGDMKSTMAGIAIGAGAVLLLGMAIKGGRKIVNHFKSKKQSSKKDRDVQRTTVETVDVQTIDEDFDDSDLTDEEE